MRMLLQSGIFMLLLLTSTSKADAQPNARDDYAIRVGPGGLTREELRFYQSGQLSAERHNHLSGEDWGTGDIQIRKAIEDEIVFQEAMAAGMHRLGNIRDSIWRMHQAKKILSETPPQSFSEEEMKAYYEKNLKEFLFPAEYLFKILTIPSPGPQMQSFYEQAKGNPNSVPGWRASGWRRKEESFYLPLTQEQEAAIYQLLKDQVSEPVLSEAGPAFIFWCLEITEPVQKTFEEARELIRYRMVRDKEAAEGKAAHPLAPEGHDLGRAVEETIFEDAIKAGVHRVRHLRELVINEYLQKRANTIGGIIRYVKDRYKVEILT